jgi:Concanavalin A-like lectin/glucanases superfamily
MQLIKLNCIVLVMLTAATGYGQQTAKMQSRSGSVTWTIDNLKKIGGQPVTVIGNPQVIKVAGGKAVVFDGVDDGLLVKTNPVAGAQAFTVEAVFRPDAGGAAEQRWFHVQEETSDDRILLETRLVGKEWFLDTFIKSGANSRPLFAENFKHPLGEWYHVALVYDGTTMRHYVDGKEELSGALTIEPLSAGSTSMGVRMNRVFWFKGAIRKARFTGRALTPKEFMKK